MPMEIEQALIAVLIPLIYLVGGYITMFAKQKLNIMKESYYKKELEELIVTAVGAVEQTFVRELKKEGALSRESQHEAFVKAYEEVRKQITERADKVLQQAYGDYMTYIQNRIEAVIDERK